MKVFLTGGTGFIGQPLAHALLARGWNVVALVRQPDSPQARTFPIMSRVKQRPMKSPGNISNVACRSSLSALTP
jgi:nucleoside-diphosphate-sugar epimerase